MYDEIVQMLRTEECLPFTALKIMRQAADAIEELSKSLDDMNEANIALYGALPKWIPVTERLPEEREDVLVALRRGEIAVDYYQPNRWGYSDVTHWMPLPALPEEEDEDDE